MRVNTVSHELLAPLRCINSFAEHIAGSLDNKQVVKEYLQMIRVTSRMLIASSSDLLDSQMLNSGKFKVNFEYQDICGLIKETSSLFTTQASFKKVSLKILVPNESVIISTDFHRVQQCMVNLISNALKFSERG